MQNRIAVMKARSCIWVFSMKRLITVSMLCLTVLVLIISALFIIPFGGEKCPNFLKVIILIITGIGVMAVYDKLTK